MTLYGSTIQAKKIESLEAAVKQLEARVILLSRYWPTFTDPRSLDELRIAAGFHHPYKGTEYGVCKVKGCGKYAGAEQHEKENR